MVIVYLISFTPGPGQKGRRGAAEVTGGVAEATSGITCTFNL